MKAIHKIKLPENYVFSIYQDERAVNPREDFDQFGTIAYCHKRYILGEENLEPYQIAAIEARKDVISLPVYLYDHGGITIGCKPFSCPWDSGQVGIIYVTHDKIKAEFGEVTEKTIEQAINYMLGEIKTFDSYLTGNVYGYSLQREETRPHCGGVKFIEIDSCWGFYGDDWENNGILDNLEKAQLEMVRAWLKNIPITAKRG